MKKQLHILLVLLLIGNIGFAQGSIQPKSEGDKYEVMKTDEEWKKQLSDEEYYVLREKGTEPRLINKYYLHKEDGMYHCKACGNPLFSSETKYDSGSGWPAFYDKEGDNIELEEDHSFGMIRSEVKCSKCGGHLGHVFEDGPNPTGLRYCINSVSLDFKPKK